VVFALVLATCATLVRPAAAEGTMMVQPSASSVVRRSNWEVALAGAAIFAGAYASVFALGKDYRPESASRFFHIPVVGPVYYFGDFVRSVPDRSLGYNALFLIFAFPVLVDGILQISGLVLVPLGLLTTRPVPPPQRPSPWKISVTASGVTGTFR
jgi:hypothetical protein